MPVTLQNIDKNLPGGANMGGLTQTIFMALWADVLTWPTEPDLDTALTLEAAASLTGDIAMQTGKNFFKVYATDDTAELAFESVGELDGKSWKYKLSFNHPGLQKKVLGFINSVKNDNLVFIVKDNNGNQFLLGNEDRACQLEESPDGVGTGKATADRPQVSMAFTFKSKNIYHYDGAIPLTPAT